MPASTWVLVAGTGTDPIPDDLATVAGLLGEALAAAGLSLVTCGWPGVDHAVGRAFAAALRARGQDPTSRLQQVCQHGREPTLREGTRVDVGQDAEEYLSAVAVADIVVLLSGLGGTFVVYQHTLQARKPALPLPKTEGDARRAFDHARTHFNRDLYLGITADDLAQLDRPPAESVAYLVRLIQQHREARAIQNGDYLATDNITGPDNERSFDQLVADMADIGVLGFVGAGASIPAGYPDWATLVDRMRQALPTQVDKAMAWLSREEDLLMRAEHYRTLLGRDYDAFIRKQFGNDRGTCGPLHIDLARLPFRHILTTNYDTLLERAHTLAFPGELPLPVDWENTSDMEAFLRAARRRSEQRRYVHLHGLYNNPTKMVLTESDYQDRYHRTTASEATLAALFTAHPFLFVGFSFSDMDVMGLFRNTMARLQVEAPLHYAFVALDPRKHDPMLVRRRLRQKFKIDPVFYLHTPDHAGLHQLVQRLRDRLAPAGTAAAQG